MIIKRNGEKVEYNSDKIYNAIKKAFIEVDHRITKDSRQIIENIVKIINAYYEEKNCKGKYDNNVRQKIIGDISVETIQDKVENLLMVSPRKDVAKAYIRYRYQRSLGRNTTDNILMELVNGDNDYWNTENSNKNPTLVTTQRDYIAGAASTDIATRILLPKEVVEADREGIIHFHDKDYFLQATLTNCFSGDTEFITSDGIKSFNDFYDGEKVIVKDKNGKWKEATVHTYGKQKMYDVTFKTPRSEKTVVCTQNHRWILKNGNVTTELKIGDVLAPTKNSTFVDIEDFSLDEIKAFCFGFVLGDGTDDYTKEGKYLHTRVRLCGNKIEYLDHFIKAGYNVSDSTFLNNDVLLNKKKNKWLKKDFLENRGWRYMSLKEKIALFNGLYAADGFQDRGGIATANKDLGLMIEEISSLAGYYLISKKEEVRDTNFKKDSFLITYRFITHQPANFCWKVKDIKPHGDDAITAWCVEEPTTHSFMLKNGMVTGNCCLINLEDMLQNGTCINKVKIEKPHRLLTAVTIATQIITAVTSSQYGGATITLTHLAPFVRDSYNWYIKKYQSWGFENDEVEEFALKDLKKEITDSVQTFNYQCNSMTTTNGQAPFLSVCMYLGETEEYKEELYLLIEEFLNQRIQGMKNEQGVWITPAFPKLLYILEEDNIYPDSKYFNLTLLAAKCTAKRMVPDYISEKIMKELKIDKNGNGNVYPCMGCRSFLTPYVDENGNPKYYGRFNSGVVTISLPDLALSSGQDFDKFWELFEERTELCHKALQCRIKRLENTLSDVAPIMWQDGALARLKKGETIGKLLYGGYSTISLGYAGLYECVKYMTGHSHTEDGGKEFGLEVMEFLNQKARQWKEAENIDYSVYGTPIESTTYKFAKCLKKRFGIIEGITDKDYITNSYHVNVREEIDPFQKLTFENEFQKLSPGGAISYIETANMENNIPAVVQVMQFIYDNIMYAELNTKSDYCQECGYTGEIKVITDNGNLVWECPNCGNRNHDTMNVTRRTCGYIGTNFWNPGRTEEIAERYVHLDNHNMEETV